jgi:hypothetical protein
MGVENFCVKAEWMNVCMAEIEKYHDIQGCVLSVSVGFLIRGEVEM